MTHKLLIIYSEIFLESFTKGNLIILEEMFYNFDEYNSFDIDC